MKSRAFWPKSVNPRDHPIFQQYPQGTATISVGEEVTPYQVYDGYGVFIGGYADLKAVQQLLMGEQVVPVQSRAGKAFMGLWACDFTNASLGPHHELQVSFFVSRGKVPPLQHHPLCLLEAMLTRPEIEMLCRGLWNDTPKVVSYNRELLGLDVKLSKGALARHRDRMTFSFRDAESGELILDGSLKKPGRPSTRANVALISKIGLMQLWRINQQPWVTMKVLNPVSELFPQNFVSETLTKNASNVVRFFAPQVDKITLGTALYGGLGFEAQFIQYMDGFKFVYPTPRLS
jgi:hypothetical protein